MSVVIRGQAKLKAALLRIERQARAVAPTAAKASAETVKSSALASVPRDTGALAESITVESHGETARVAAGERYARFVHYGTRNTQAQPYMDPDKAGVVGAMIPIFTAVMR
jgi:HK97 gp10 family phage protein